MLWDVFMQNKLWDVFMYTVYFRLAVLYRSRDDSDRP